MKKVFLVSALALLACVLKAQNAPAKDGSANQKASNTPPKKESPTSNPASATVPTNNAPRGVKKEAKKEKIATPVVDENGNSGE